MLSAVLGVVILSVCLSVCHTCASWLIQRTYRRYFYTTRKGNHSSQMWFFVQLCSSWQDFNWLKGWRSLPAAVELLVHTFMKKLLRISDCSEYPVCHLVSLCSCCLSKMSRRSWMRRRRLLNISGLVITVVIMLVLHLNNCTYNVLDNVENVKMYLYQQFPLVTLTSYISLEL